MNKKIKIIIAGIGGVGGYFGGQLARTFAPSNDVEIFFLARGEHLRRIKENGLKVIKGDTEFYARPKMATDNANDIGIADYILVCTKSYDLEATMMQLKPCIGANTIIIPLLNGVDSMQRISTWLPAAKVVNGCVYIVSLIKEPGVVENTGNIQKLFFGSDTTNTGDLVQLEQLLKQAGIEATLSNNISSVLWEKFHLVGANSTATSFYPCTTGELLADSDRAAFLFSLLREVNSVALASGIVFDKDMVAVTIEKLRSFPFGATSSMQRDFSRHDGRTELETITGYVVREGHRLNIPVPAFEIAYNKLRPHN